MVYRQTSLVYLGKLKYMINDKLAYLESTVKYIKNDIEHESLMYEEKSKLLKLYEQNLHDYTLLKEIVTNYETMLHKEEKYKEVEKFKNKVIDFDNGD